VVLGTLAAMVACPAAVLAQPLDLAPADPPSQTDSFTANELRQLHRGELVIRPAALRRGDLDLVGGTSWQAVDAPADVVWHTVLDTADYVRMLPAVTDARLLEQQGHRRVIWLHHSYSMIDASYCLVATLQPERRTASFQIDDSRPHSMRAGWGFLTVRPYGMHRSMVSYGILADIGHGMASGLLAPTIRDWMLRVPATVKEFIESRR
jgi:ribosome-associated toxin RatA of RatAB toxin-antitoxin module